MISNQNQDWLKEYNEFVTATTNPVPRDLSEKVIAKMDELINPKASTVFSKIFGLHLVIGFSSLAVCHQFGMNPFNTSKSLADVFMNLGGHGFCMLACGVLFLALTLMGAGVFLTLEEVQVLRRTEFIQTFGLGIISLGIFAVAGADLALTFAGLWLLGALIGGYIATETVWHLKKAH